MDRLAAMEAFVRVIEAGSFSGAAKQLRVGQPAVSKTIAQLEDRLGVRLLLRSTHGLTPTDAGRDFYEHANGRSRMSRRRKPRLATPPDRCRGDCGSMHR
jgi:DNA-binding transcriptional LysR family regulator